MPMHEIKNKAMTIQTAHEEDDELGIYIFIKKYF